MEALVAKSLTAGDVPVIPHMPWSASSTGERDGGTGTEPCVNETVVAALAPSTP